MYGKNVNLHWKSSKFSLALQPEALVNTSGRVDFSSPVYLRIFSGIFKAVDQVTNFDPPETEIRYSTLKAQMFLQQRGGQMRSLVWAFVDQPCFKLHDCMLISTFVVVVAFTQTLSYNIALCSVVECPLSEREVSGLILAAAPYQRCKKGISSSLADARIKRGCARHVSIYLLKILLCRRIARELMLSVSLNKASLSLHVPFSNILFFKHVHAYETTIRMCIFTV